MPNASGSNWQSDLESERKEAWGPSGQAWEPQGGLCSLQTHTCRQAVLRVVVARAQRPGQQGSWKGHGRYLEMGSRGGPGSFLTGFCDPWGDKHLAVEPMAPASRTG